VYLEQIERNHDNLQHDAIEYNETMGQFASVIADIEGVTGVANPSVKT
jgi:hypothetical protein